MRECSYVWAGKDAVCLLFLFVFLQPVHREEARPPVFQAQTTRGALPGLPMPPAAVIGRRRGPLQHQCPRAFWGHLLGPFGAFRGWQRGMAARQGLTGFLFRLRLRCFGRTTAPRRRCAGWSGLGPRPIRARQPSLALLAEFRTKSRFQALSLR